MTYELHEMDCRLAMSMLMDAGSVDSIVTDPPYGLSKEPDMTEVLRHWLAGDDYEHGGSGFMGKTWDSFVPGPSVWREAYRVLKPGGHLVAFFGTRTYDLGVLAIRLAGFEIRDQIGWAFGSGFPKSHDVSKGIDKALGAERAVLSERPNRSSFDPNGEGGGGFTRGTIQETDGSATPEAAKWSGWGTALKPAFEPIVIARKPLVGTVAQNVMTHGTGAINIDRTRVGLTDEDDPRLGGKGSWTTSKEQSGDTVSLPRGTVSSSPLGRWPANIIHDGSDEVLAVFPEAPGQQRASRDDQRSQGEVYGRITNNGGRVHEPRGDSGSAARFFQACQYDEDDILTGQRLFYCAKASKADRNEGLDDLPERPSAASEFRPNHAEGAANGESGNPYGRWSPVRNTHPTVKPTALMRYLCRLVTPPGGLVLDPFAGSGSTGKAAMLEGFDFVGCEMTPEYAEIARRRIDHALRNR